MAKNESKKIEIVEEQIISLNGLVVDCSLPSKAMLVDWLSKEVGEVRIKEVVELFPKEIFRELEAIRRLFYYKMVALTVPAYSLKLIPLDALPKFQEAIEQAKKRLKILDIAIAGALKDSYSMKARKYMELKGNGKARIIKSISQRFTVSILPLQLNRMIWKEFLDATLKKQLAAIHEKYELRKNTLEKELGNVLQELASSRNDLERSKVDVEKAYEGITVPVDIVTMKLEKKELQGKISDLKAQITKKKRQLNSLADKEKGEVNSFNNSRSWVKKQVEETGKKITFNAKKLYQDQLETMIRESLELLKEDQSIRNKALKTMVYSAKASWDRVFYLMPTSRLPSLFEKVIVGLNLALEGKLEGAKKQLEAVF